jgi:hypothetical protein
MYQMLSVALPRSAHLNWCGRPSLLREIEGQVKLGFIDGNWAVYNDEITFLRDLGCHADFTMPSGDNRTNTRACTLWS